MCADTRREDSAWACSTPLSGLCLGCCHLTPSTGSPLYWEKTCKQQWSVSSICLYLVGLPCACPLFALWDRGVYLPLFLLGERKGVDPLVSGLVGCGRQSACCMALWVHLTITDSPVRMKDTLPHFHPRHSDYCFPVIILLCQFWSLSRGILSL